jgi:hypothetical protein
MFHIELTPKPNNTEIPNTEPTASLLEPPQLSPDRVVNEGKSFAFIKYSPEKAVKTFGKIGEYLLLIGIACLIIYGFMNKFIGDPKEQKEEIKQAKQEIKINNQKIDSIKLDQNFLLSRIYEVEKNQLMFYSLIDENNKLIVKNNKELNNLKRIYNEKINNINSYNYKQLDSFFTNRYSEYYKK